MCIICVSKSGVPQPDYQTISNMFSANPHGAGYMFARDGRVIIHKGFMGLDDFMRAIECEEFTAEDSVVYHFRISTQAGVNPEMTHPFPLTNQERWMRMLDLTCGVGIAHNGIIRLTSDPDNRLYSDTSIFINRYMSRMVRKPSDLRNQDVLDSIEGLAHSKFAIMDGTGYIATIGKFAKEDNGLLYSNVSYRDDWQAFRRPSARKEG